MKNPFGILFTTVLMAAGPLVVYAQPEQEERAASAAALDVDTNLPRYHPQPAAAPSGAGYVLPDGSVQIIGFEGMYGIVENLNRLFVSTHAQLKFTLRNGNNASAMGALTFGATAFAPMSSEFTASALYGHVKLLSVEPLAIRVAHASLNRNASLSPLAVITHKDNPLESVTVNQVMRMFSTGAPGGDLAQWNQLGIQGELAGRAIHPYGLPESDYYPSEDPGFGAFVVLHKMNGSHFKPNYETRQRYGDVVQSVSLDPQAIGLVGLNRVSPEVKVLAVRTNEWSSPTRGVRREIEDGFYPFDRYLYIYVRLVPGEPFDPLVKEYLRMVLSREGQQTIAAEAHGYIPLNEREVLEELTKLNQTRSAAQPREGPASTPPSAQFPERSRSAPYVLPDGSIYFAGNDLVEVLFQKYNALFSDSHPGSKFKMDMQDSNLAIPGITSGKSAFGPIARDATKQELDGFTALYGYPPADVLLGYNQTPNTDIFPPGKTPPAIWINATNPLPVLTLAQVTRVFMTGAEGGDITHWGQLGVGGEWAHRAIHVYVPGNPDAAFVFYEGQKMGRELRYTRRAEWLPGTRDVMSAVARDPFGIGLIGFWPPDSGWDRQAELGSRAKLLALAATADDKASHAALGDLYPLTPGIHIYFNRMPGKPIEPWLKDYLTLVLSRQGQELLTLMAHEVGNSFIPLGPQELAKQLAKLK